MKTTIFESKLILLHKVLWILWLCFFLVSFYGCKSFPYKIDPSGDCLFVKNDQARLPADESPFVNNPTPVVEAPAPNVVNPRETIAPPGMTTIPGVNVIPGAADATAPRSLGTIPAAPLVKDRATLAIPGSGPIMLVDPQEQIALVGSEIVVLGSYLGDDQYLRTGEKVEWSLDGVGHLMMTNKAECGSWMFGNFTKDKKVSDRYAVASTTLYEGVLDRGAPDQSGNIPVLAGQSWVAVQSAVEGTTTVTAMAPSITDWQRRSDRAVIHWIDAEWIFPVPDLAKIGSAKPVTTTIKKRSSNAPCPGWLVRYEILGGPEAVFEHTGTKIAEVATNENGQATVNIRQAVGETGTNTFSVRIIRPAGVDNGSKRLDLGARTIALTWTHDDIVDMQVIAPENSRYNTPMTWTIELANFSGMQRDGWMTLNLPDWVTYISCTPMEPRSTAASLGTGKALIWDNISIPAKSKVSISLTLQANGDSNEAKELIIKPTFTQFGSSTGSPSGASPGGNTTVPGMGIGGSGNDLGSYITPPGYPGTGSQAPPTPPAPGGGGTNSSSGGSSIQFDPSPTPPGYGTSGGGLPLPGGGGSTITPAVRNVSIQLTPPDSMQPYQPAVLKIQVINSGQTVLENGFLILEFPEGMYWYNTQTKQLQTVTSLSMQEPIGAQMEGIYDLSIQAQQIGDYRIKISAAAFRSGSSKDYDILDSKECQIRVRY